MEFVLANSLPVYLIYLDYKYTGNKNYPRVNTLYLTAIMKKVVAHSF